MLLLIANIWLIQYVAGLLALLATISKEWEIPKKWEKLGFFCGANFQIISENRQILDAQTKLKSL